MNEWISVEERLPELKPWPNENDIRYWVSDFVLCANIPASNHMAAPEIWIFYLCRYNESLKGEWSYIGENNPGVITHWMPLPKLPM